MLNKSLFSQIRDYHADLFLVLAIQLLQFSYNYFSTHVFCTPLGFIGKLAAQAWNHREDINAFG